MKGLWRTEFALLLFIFGAYLISGTSDYEEAQITAKHVNEAQEKKNMSPCDFTAISYGPYHHKKDPECVGKGGPLPDHILTLPVESK